MMLTPSQLHILRHALGVDQYGCGNQHRNRYICGPGHDGFDDCRTLTGAGLMVEHPPREIFGGDSCFQVTAVGRVAMREQSPSPPKLTRSQRRYRAWLRADCGISFGEWVRDNSRQTATRY